MKKLTTIFFIFFGLGLFAQTTAFQENFETTPIGMTSDTISGHYWDLNTRLHSQGVKSDSASVANGDTIYLTTTTFSTVNKYDVILSFDHICKLEFADGGIIEVSTNNGITWTKLTGGHYISGNAQFANIGNKFNASSYGLDWNFTNNIAIPQNTWWKTEVFNISAIAANSSSVKIRFGICDMNSNGSYGNAGWFLDSIFVTASFSELIPPNLSLITPILKDTSYTSGPFNVGASISDASGIDTAICIFKVMPGNTIDTIAMVYDNTTIDSFYCSLPFYGFGRTISYYVKAYDASAAHNTDSSASYNFFCKNNPNGDYFIGTGTDLNTVSGYPAVFGQYYTGDKEQYLVLASELQAINTIPGNILAIGFDVVTANSATNQGVIGNNHNNFTIKMKNTTVSALSSTFETGLNQVYTTSSYQTIVGWNEFTFSTPFVWDGVSNVIVEVCFDNYVTGYSYSTNTIVNRTSTTFNSASYYRHDGGSVCSNSTGSAGPIRPNIKLVAPTSNGMSNDIGVLNILNPTGGVANNAVYDIDIDVKNYGVDTVTTAWINWTFDGVLQTPYHLTDSLKADSVSAIITLATKSATAGTHSIVVWTDSVNNTLDNDISNDTASFSFYGCASSFSGNYTIGGTNPDFATFTDAALALNQCGITGAVTFIVASGTYIEQIKLMAINGSSSTNTVTFQSATGDSSAVILKYDAAGTIDNYVIELNGTNYITFKDMTIEAMDTTFARALVMKNGVHNVSVLNSVVKTTNASLVNDDEMALIFCPDSLGANINIQNNLLTNGSRAISLLGGTAANNWVINNNIIHGHYGSAIFLDNTISVQLNENDIKADTLSTVKGYVGIYLLNNTGTANVTKNKILTTATQVGYGIRFTSCVFDSLNPSTIVNNFVQMNCNSTGTTLSAGILNHESKNVNVFFNTVRMSGVQYNSTSIALYDGTAGLSKNINIVNNIFANNAGGYIYYVNNVDTALWVNHHNNLYDYNNSAIYAYLGSNVSDFASWVVSSGATDCDTIMPYFVSASNLHVTNNLLDGGAFPISGITTDIDGDIRDIQNPDIGADEFIPSPWDVIALEILSPISSCGLDSTELVTVRFKNIGSTTINGNFSAKYQLLGSSSIVSENITDSIQPGDTLDYVFTTPLNLSVVALGADSIFNIKAWGDLMGDNNTYNDSTSILVFSGYVPGSPSTTGDTVTYGTGGAIYAQGNTTYFWSSDTATNYLVQDTVYNTPQLYDTTIYWVSDRAYSGIDSVHIGSGTLTNSHLPVEPYYRYTYSQTIYKAAYINNQAGNIESISYQYIGNNGFGPDSVRIYLGTTNKTSFSGTTDWVPLSNLTLVYDGTMTAPAGGGWITFTLSAPFAYDGISNLVIGFDENTQSKHSSSDDFASSTLDSDVKSIYFYNNVTNPNPISPPTSGSSLGTTAASPNTKFAINALSCFSDRTPVTVIVDSILNDDVGLTTLQEPYSGFDLSASENVSVTIKNFAVITRDTIPVAYQLDTLPIVYDTLFSTLHYGDSSQFTFSQKVDLLAYKTYDLTIWTGLGIDQYNFNDTIYTQVTNNMLTFCSCSATSTAYEDITNVTIKNLNNSTLPVGAMYNDYSTSVNPALLSPGKSYNVSISSDFPSGYTYSYNCWVNVFIDYNHNGTFDPTAELAYSVQSSSSNTVNGIITIPSTGIITDKPLRMRVVLRENGNVSNTGPCGTFSRGEVEDYTVVIIAPIPQDAGIANINPIGTVITTSATTIFADIKNFGTDSLVKASINWKIDTTTQAIVPWTGSLYKDSIDYNVSLGSHTFTNGSHTIKAWTSLPNDSIDIHGFNDTLTINVYGCQYLLSGTYTLGSPTSDFSTFNDALIALNNCGVVGHVIFNVDSGLYTGQLEFTTFPGVSDTSTVTFQSATGDSTDVVITYGATSTSDNSVVNFHNASYVNLNKLTIKSNSTTYGRVLLFTGNNSNNKITNCVIKASNSTSTNMSAIYKDGNLGSHNEFINNEIKNGYYCIYWKGVDATTRDVGTIFKRNIINGYNKYGAYIYYQDSLIFENNVLENNPSLGAYSGYGIYSYYSSNASRFVGNKVNIESYSSYGIYLNYNQTTNNARGLVANNMVSCKSGSTQYGIYGYKNKNVDYLYNSVNLYNSTSINTRSLYLYSGNNLRVLNNVLSNQSSGYALYVSTTSAIDTINYNNYYALGSNIAYWNGNKAIVDSLRAANNMDSMSISINPLFYSNTNLHSTSSSLVGAALPVQEVLVDFDSEVRDTIASVMGADEFNAAAVDLGIVALENPTTSQCYGSSELIIVKLHNYGVGTVNFAIDTAHIHVVTTGIGASILPIINVASGLLSSGADTSILITTNFNMSTSGNYTFNAYSVVTSDGNSANDAMTAVNLNVSSSISLFPYTEDFETSTPGNPGVLANGWTRNSNSFKWLPNSGGTISVGTGPLGDHTTGNGKYVYTEASTIGGDADLTSPCLDISGFTNPELRFWYHMYGNGIGTLYIQALNANAIWVDIDSIVGQQQTTQNAPWLQHSVGLGGFTQGTTKIRFHGVRAAAPTAYDGDISIDDIYINEPKQWDIGAKAIIKPSKAYSMAGTTLDTIQIQVKNFGWGTITATTGATVSYVYAGQSPVTINITNTILPYSSVLIDITTPISVIGGGKGIQAYTTFTLDSVNTNDTTEIDYMGVMVKTLPYNNNFEVNIEFFTEYSGLWKRGIPNGSNINAAYSSPNVWMTDLNTGYSNNAVEYVYTPFFDFSSVPTGDTAIMSFYHWIDVSTNDGGFIQFSSDGGQTWGHLGFMTDPFGTNWYNTNVGGTHMWSNSSTGWQYSDYELSQFNGSLTSIQFRFVFMSNASGNTNDGWAIDDFKIEIPKVSIDAGVVAINSPTSVAIGATTSVDIIVKNFGLNALTSIPVEYTVGSNTVTEIVTIPASGLLTDSTIAYSFATTFVAPNTVFSICAKTNIPDLHPQNDQTCKQIQVTTALIDVATVEVSVNPSWSDTTKGSFQDTVTIKLLNNGLNTLTSIDLEYKVGTTVIGTATWNGSLVSLDTLVYTFIQTYTSPFNWYMLCANAFVLGDNDNTNNEFCKNYYGLNDIGFGDNDAGVFSVDQNTPNPASGRTIVNYCISKSGMVYFELYNTLGQIIFSEKYDNQVGDNMIAIDVNNLLPGIYYYTVEFEKKRITYKMIVK